jgi:thiosulfate reductase cytochrome b subunit
MKRIYIYKQFERFWHWTQAALIIFLAVTGFEVHDSIHVFGFEKAVRFHRIASYALLALIAFAVFWHITTGEWRQYIPTTKKLRDQLLYYTMGMFQGAPHPTEKNQLSKLNPLQRIIYLSFKIVLIPLIVISGLLYMFHKTFDENNIVVIKDISLESIAVWHTLGAFLLVAFLLIHVYMTTTGAKPTSNIKAMLTGYEEVEEKQDKKDNA